MFKHEDISKSTQSRGIQADECCRVVQATGSAGILPARDYIDSSPASGSAGILPAFGKPNVSPAKDCTNCSSANGSASVSPANEPDQAKSAKGWYSRDYLPHLDSLVYCLVLIGDMSESPSGQLLGARSQEG